MFWLGACMSTAALIFTRSAWHEKEEDKIKEQNSLIFKGICKLSC